MNAVVQFQPQTQAVSNAPSFSMNDMERVALAIAKGGLFGSSDPNAVLTLCMLAQAEGQHPAVVFRDYHIISGKPAKKSEAMQRDFLMAGGKIEWHRLDDDCVDATFSHPAGGTVRIAWDAARVAQAQLGNNPMHKKYPRQMKKARVIAEGVRTVWPSATSGLYESGEVQDIVTDAAPVTPPAPRAKRARDMAPATIDGGELNAAPQQEQTDKAADWASALIEEIKGAATIEIIDGIVAKAAKGLAKLRADRPELAAEIDQVEAERRAWLDDDTTEEVDAF